MGGPITQYCGRCKVRKPITGFDIELGLCAMCSATVSAEKGSPSVETPESQYSPALLQWKCPKCLQQVPVEGAVLAVLEDHLNGRDEICGGSGYSIPQKSQDAMDYRVPGSFESGKG